MDKSSSPDLKTSEPVSQSEQEALGLLQPLSRPSRRQKTWPGTVHSGEFLRSFTPPSYIIDGVVQQGYLYTLTGVSGSGKTFVALRLAAAIALGQPFGPHKTTQGGVVYLAGENFTDVQPRWAALAREMNFDPDTIP